MSSTICNLIKHTSSNFALFCIKFMDIKLELCLKCNPTFNLQSMSTLKFRIYFVNIKFLHSESVAEHTFKFYSTITKLYRKHLVLFLRGRDCPITHEALKTGARNNIAEEGLMDDTTYPLHQVPILHLLLLK